MNLEALIIAVKTRLEADTGTGGLFAVGSPLVTGVYAMIAPFGATYPYLFIDVAGTGVQDAFALDLLEVRFRVHCFATADNGYEPIDNIMRRVYGAAGRTPTYGLHRHALAMAGSPGWSALPIRFDGMNTDNDQDHYHIIHDYVTYLQRAST